MKIAFVSVFFPFRGGIAHFADLFSNELTKQGHAVERINFKRQYPSVIFPGKTQFVEGKSKKDLSSASLDSLNPLSWFATKKALKKEEFDVYVVAYWMSFFGFMKATLLKKTKTKRVLLVHNLVPHEQKFFDQYMAKKLLENCDGAVVLSEKVETEIQKLYPKLPVKRLYHPLYNQFGEKLSKEVARKKLGLRMDVDYMLFFGLIRSYKGLDVLLETMQFLPEHIHLIIAGECYESKSYYDEIIRKTNSESRVVFHERFILDDEVAAYFSAANVCVLPYKTATQSGITAISLAFDLPVIATKVGGLPEIIEDQKDGILVDAAEPLLLKEAIVSYFSNHLEEKFAQVLSEKKKQYSWENFAMQFTSFVRSLSSKAI